MSQSSSFDDVPVRRARGGAGRGEVYHGQNAGGRGGWRRTSERGGPEEVRGVVQVGRELLLLIPPRLLAGVEHRVLVVLIARLRGLGGLQCLLLRELRLQCALLLRRRDGGGGGLLLLLFRR